MMSNPKVSVIVPCYGVEKYLNRCMESIVNQTLREIEIILVDDGSPDRVPEMCDEWRMKDSRIKVIHKDNAGLGFARNSGLDVATGQYVAFVDSDDYIELTMYETLYEEARTSDADVVYCGFKTEISNGIWKDSKEVEYRTEWVGEDVEIFMLDMVACVPNIREERKYQMSVWHAIYKRSIIYKKELRFLSERIVVSEDLPFHVDFLKHSQKVVYLANSFYFYCLNTASLTTIFRANKYDGFKQLYGVLTDKLVGIEDSFVRIDRFFIGYTRSLILHLIMSKYKNKRECLTDICNDLIWKEISSRFKASWLPIYSQIIYTLILKHKILLLIVFCHVVIYIKKRRNLRV